MRRLALRFMPVYVALLGGCAAPSPPRPSLGPTLSLEQLVRALHNRKLTSRGTSNDGFGLEAFKLSLRPLELRCQADGGQLTPVDPAGVVFTFRDANSIPHEARVYVPQRVACRSGGETLWGVQVRFNEPTFFPSAWAEAVFYYATVSLTFELGTAFGRSDPNGAVNRVACKDADDCQPFRERYTQRLRSDPKVGMYVQFGAIIDVRLPLVQVQYDEFGRRLKGRDQEWVPASTLNAGANCPR